MIKNRVSDHTSNPSSKTTSDFGDNENIFFCMMPNGVSTEISLELDLDIEQVKEKIVEFVR